jgi:hypothetical protein
MSSISFTWLVCAALGAGPGDDNLDFHKGTLAGWQGNGFHVTTASRLGPSLRCGVTSSDSVNPKHKGQLHRAVVIPARASVLRCSAYATRGIFDEPEGTLDIVLYTSGNQIIPKKVLTTEDWEPADALLDASKGKPRDYQWNVSKYAGQTLGLVLIDEDKRPGCYVYCSGFHFVAKDAYEGRDFSRSMAKLAREHELAPMTRFDSKHFIALSNADDDFSELRLHNCELIYDLFYEHFRSRGFRLQEPSSKLMVAIFDSQTGFEAYLQQKMPVAVTGIYHPGTNRLVVYDFAQSNALVAQEQQARKVSRQIGNELERQRFLGTVSRRSQEIRTGVNIATIMHEVAHQLSFNSGLLNREGDVPVWLAEGLACYCEPAENGSWQGIGEVNRERINTLVRHAANRGSFLPLRSLVASDEWLRGANAGQTAILGYAQSWALFHMLMSEEHLKLRAYLSSIYDRRTPDVRWADFAEAMGPNLHGLQERYAKHLQELVDDYGRGRR